MTGLPCIALLFDHGLDEWGLLAAIVFILFGPRRIPDFARTIGRMLEKFRQAADSLKRDIANLDSDVSSPSSADAPPSDRLTTTLPTHPLVASPDPAQRQDAASQTSKPEDSASPPESH